MQSRQVIFADDTKLFGAGEMGCHAEGPEQAWEADLCKPHTIQQRPAHGLGPSQAQTQAG